jgi:hypothetical protein
LVTFDLTGVDLFTGLEVALEAAQGMGLNDLWPQVSNVRVWYDPVDRPPPWIWDVRVGNEQLDVGATYSVTANLGIAMLLPEIAGIQPQNIQMTGITEYEALRGYIMKHSPVTPDSDCRIEMKQGIGDGSQSGIPTSLILMPNQPNPFSHTTELSYALPEDGQVHLDVFTLTGQRVATLLNEWQSAGTRSVVWDAGALPSGLYIQRLKCGNRTVSRPMTLLR